MGDKGMSAKVGIKRVNNRIFFDMVSNAPISHELATTIQTQAGYPPQGYGIPYGLGSYKNESGGFVTTWYCYASCD